MTAPMPPDKIDEMKRAAEAATQGEWSHCGTLPASGTFHVCVDADTVDHRLIALHVDPSDALHIVASCPANVLALIADRDALLARAERAEAERDEARSAAEQAYGLLWQISTDDKRVHAARKILLHFVGKDGQRRGIAATRPSPCGHPISLAATGVETGIVTCEFCDTRQQLDDAVSEEARWSARAERAEAKIAKDRATIEKMRDEWEREALTVGTKGADMFYKGAARFAESILAATKGDKHD